LVICLIVNAAFDEVLTHDAKNYPIKQAYTAAFFCAALNPKLQAYSKKGLKL
jgi:hypothetical protein